MEPVVIVLAVIGAVAVLLIVLGAGWRKPAEPEPRGEERPQHREAAEAIMETRYQVEEDQAAALGDLPHVEDPVEAGHDATLLGGDSWGNDQLAPMSAEPVDESSARIVPDAGTVVGAPETHAPTVVGHEDKADRKARRKAAKAAG